MVRMRVRDRHVFDVGGLDAELLELGGERLGPAPRRRGAFALLAIRHGGDCIGDAGVPQEPALGVVDQVAIVRDVERLADIDAGRPARLVGTGALSTTPRAGSCGTPASPM